MGAQRREGGRDAGELCGLPPVGVAATNDAEALLALDADVVCYTATADLRPWEAVKDICRILESGKNVVSSSLVQLLHPPKADPAMVERLEEACKAGGVSMFTSGIDPGFANDLLPIVLTGFCERVDHVRVKEILNYATYDQPEVLFGTMGFGKPLDDTPLLLIPGALSYAWGGAINMIADALDVEVTEVRERHEKASLDHDVEIGLGTVEAGHDGRASLRGRRRRRWRRAHRRRARRPVCTTTSRPTGRRATVRATTASR